jgi:hypothetical protein
MSMLAFRKKQQEAGEQSPKPEAIEAESTAKSKKKSATADAQATESNKE